ncbi:MAG TPA: flagellar basal body P-ring protein FlgI [Geminicoccus sp.]|uniref:flagellar basal body P-ring protein FlgI n=1 Tax=Geminicoccus sp. TaxID=2024832 RepID=UPI002C2B744A|nr:flagellar basal body P-ring protein FlgI [Geminicoccus sp.]HWL68477.1 flagellar basal body P-ring protein FlgI [Geminicoccus sp.]
MFHRLALSLLLLFTLLCRLVQPDPAQAAQSRIKDVADFEGVRDNMLVGYGLVVGLNSTGDSLRNSAFTQESLTAMLDRLGVATRGGKLNTKNVAAVMVTATLPPFARQGSRVDVAVSALGDAKSLNGGTLLVTPLMGADGEIYAVAQGALTTGGFEVGGEAEKVTRGVPTSARIPSGAIVEREVAFALADLQAVRLALRNPDFTTATRIAAAVNRWSKTVGAQAVDPATVVLEVPAGYRDRIALLMSEVEQLRIDPDQPARILVDETKGIIVIGENVRISTVAIAQGNLTVRVTETPQVSQPAPFSDGETVVTPQTNVQVDDQSGRRMAVLSGAVTLQDLVDGLNAMGVGPRDMIGIIQAIKAAGALQAEIEVM